MLCLGQPPGMAPLKCWHGPGARAHPRLARTPPPLVLRWSLASPSPAAAALHRPQPCALHQPQPCTGACGREGQRSPGRSPRVVGERETPQPAQRGAHPQPQPRCAPPASTAGGPPLLQVAYMPEEGLHRVNQEFTPDELEAARMLIKAGCPIKNRHPKAPTMS
jgi:hypothetical protein